MSLVNEIVLKFSVVKQAVAQLKHGQKFNYTKFYSGDEFTVSFPTAMGLPFVYSMRTPSLVQYGGEVQAKPYPEYQGDNDEISIPEGIKASADIHAVYSKKMIARIGFVNPASHEHHVAGFDKNFQINLPLSTEIDFNIEDSHVRVKLEPIDEQKTYNLVHYSNWPYTVPIDLLNEKPASDQKGYNSIDVRDTQKNEWSFGQKSTGFAFRLTSENQNDPQQNTWARAAEMLQGHDALSPLAYFGQEDTIEQSNYNLYWDGQRSSNDAVVLTFSYSNMTKGMGGDEGSADYKHPAGRKSSDYQDDDSKDSGSDHATAPQPNSAAPDSESRQRQFLNKAAAGIKDAHAQVIDIGAEFVGKKKAQYAATIAMASSSVDKRSRVVFFYGSDPAEQKNYQICLTAQSQSPNVPVMDFLRALKADPTTKFEAELKFGEKCQSGATVQIQGKAQQSDERKEYLRKSPTAKQCAQQMQQGNNALPACRNVTARANNLDEGYITVKYQHVPAAVKNISAQAYGLVRYLAFHNAYENTVDPQHQKDGQIDIEYEFSEDFERFNVSMNAPNLDANITNLEVPEWAQPLVAVDPVQSAARRLGREAFAGQYLRKWTTQLD